MHHNLTGSEWWMLWLFTFFSIPHHTLLNNSVYFFIAFVWNWRINFYIWSLYYIIFEQYYDIPICNKVVQHQLYWSFELDRSLLWKTVLYILRWAASVATLDVSSTSPPPHNNHFPLSTTLLYYICDTKNVSRYCQMFLVCMCVCMQSVIFDFCDPMNCSLPGSSVHGIF